MIHIVSLPHTLLTEDYSWCAFSAKVWRFSNMLSRASVPHVVYGPDVHDKVPESSFMEYVPIVFEKDRVEWFGNKEWPRDRTFNRWDVNDPCWSVMNERAAKEIRLRWVSQDIVGIIGGMCQQPIVDALNDLGPMVVEWGIGYSGVLPGSHKVFESYAWMHHIAGQMRSDDIRYFDTVIPNCFDTDDFKPSYDNSNKDPYLLFMARPIPRKGIDIVAEIAKRVDIPVKIAGQPGVKIANTEHVGVVTGAEKYELLAGATALLSPTVYLEPFGGVAVEAMMSGTPAITTDYGAYVETVNDGITGFRCRTLKDFLLAVEKAPSLNRRNIAYHAEINYSLVEGSYQYKRYFERLNSLFSDGWYSL